jgi:hypothetical protein
MHKIIVLSFSTLVLASGFISAFSSSAAAVPISQVKQACDNMNKQKAGSCTMKQAQFKVMAGCAQEAGKSPVCFECPVDDKRMCYAVSGKGGKYLNVNVSSSGTFVEAVIKGCDLVANAQNKGQCHYNIVTRHGTVGTTSVSGIAFECPDDKDCHARSGARLP